MKRILLIIIVCLMLYLAVIGQSENLPCPKISVNGSASLIKADSGEPVIFTASVENPSDDLKLEYVWSISAGKIVSGHGTKTIEINVENLDKETVTAIVEIKGLPVDCPKIFSGTGIALKRDPHNCLDVYRKISRNEEFFEMDQVMFQLWQSSNVSVVFVLNFSGKPSQKQINNRILRMLKPFAFRKKLGELDRVTFVIGEEDEEYTRICYFLKGKEKVDFNSSNVIKGVNIDVSSLTKPKKSKK